MYYYKSSGCCIPVQLALYVQSFNFPTGSAFPTEKGARVRGGKKIKSVLNKTVFVAVIQLLVTTRAAVVCARDKESVFSILCMKKERKHGVTEKVI